MAHQIDGDAAEFASVTFDCSVYSLDVIKKAAYRFGSIFAVDITRADDKWACSFAFRNPTDAQAARRHIYEFKAEILDQDLRQTISRETEALRNTILAVAFSRSGLQEGE